MYALLYIIYLYIGMTVTEPKYTELGVVEIGQKLQANLSWLTNIYGRAEKLTDSEGKQSPQYYNTGNEYINLLPDGNKGNFVYFEFEDSQSFKNFAPGHSLFNYRMNLVFWFDYRTVYVDHEERNIENIKFDIMAVLTSSFKSVQIKINEFSDDAETVYRGYDFDLSNQFNRRPYGCLKISCEAKFISSCLPITSIINIPLTGIAYYEHYVEFNCIADGGSVVTILNELADNYLAINWTFQSPLNPRGQIDDQIGYTAYAEGEFNNSPISGEIGIDTSIPSITIFDVFPFKEDEDYTQRFLIRKYL